MKLSKRIRVKEREIEQARAALQLTADELKQLLHRRLASRSALVLGFAGGLLLGWSRPRRPRKPIKTRARAAAERTRQSLPPHWLGSYLVWPFVLATARDFMVARRPSRREGEATSNP